MYSQRRAFARRAMVDHCLAGVHQQPADLGRAQRAQQEALENVLRNSAFWGTFIVGTHAPRRNPQIVQNVKRP